MKRKLRRLAERHSFTLVALTLAWLLKRHYSQASAEDLRWILAPTTWLTSLLVDGEFAFRDGQGYLSREQSVLISPACAGVNFLIVALLSLQLGFSSHCRGLRGGARWLAASAGLAYLTTLVVNALRIGLSIAVAHLAVRITGLTFQSIHRLLGVFIYLAGLMALCLTVQLWLSSRVRAYPEPAHPAVGSRALLVALGCYGGVTLVVPLLRGSASNPEYWAHAAPVSVLVVGLAALLFAARGRTWDDGRHAVCSTEHAQRVTPQQGSGG
jgi:exosortase K